MLRLAARGLDNGSIARELPVGLETVKTHPASVYGKLGVIGAGTPCSGRRNRGFFSRAVNQTEYAGPGFESVHIFLINI